MLLRSIHHLRYSGRAVARSEAGGTLKVSADTARACVFGILLHVFGCGHRQLVGILLLHSCQRFGRPHYATQALVIMLIGGHARRPPAERYPHGDVALLFCYILMNCIVGEARERTLPAGDEQLDLIGSGELAKLIEDGSGLVAS